MRSRFALRAGGWFSRTSEAGRSRPWREIPHLPLVIICFDAQLGFEFLALGAQL
jgi:hypothetical protein